ncbi:MULTISPECIES: putative holin-like toxin [Aneurinibacillus]|nr:MULTISPECIES: putative holin-like toxin [Aneurinibacillus]MED0675872.1 putative holin-like toxin [Aneurinibacillus thermoaerophilus]MED0737220.1 putative holin-like toxin [Aneurinibacillus thermoaerophilus]MED0738875.1 putative holin-like toxin [Aneurinibacillus thermoaerophilus]
MTVYEAISLMLGCGVLVATIFIAVFTAIAVMKKDK